MDDYGYSDSNGLGKFSLKKFHKRFNPIAVAKSSIKGHKKLFKKTNPLALAKGSLARHKKLFAATHPWLKKKKHRSHVDVETQDAGQDSGYTPVKSTPYSGNDESDSQENDTYDSQEQQENYSNPDDGVPNESTSDDDQSDPQDEGMGFVWLAALAQAAAKGIDRLRKSKATKKAAAAARKSLATSLIDKTKRNNGYMEYDPVTGEYVDKGRRPVSTNMKMGLAAGAIGLAALFLLTSRKRGR